MSITPQNYKFFDNENNYFSRGLITASVDDSEVKVRLWTAWVAESRGGSVEGAPSLAVAHLHDRLRGKTSFASCTCVGKKKERRTFREFL